MPQKSYARAALSPIFSFCWRRVMTFRTGITLTLLTVFLVVAAAWVSAQVTRPPSETGLKPMDLVAPQVISGSD